MISSNPCPGIKAGTLLSRSASFSNLTSKEAAKGVATTGIDIHFREPLASHNFRGAVRRGDALSWSYIVAG